MKEKEVIEENEEENGNFFVTNRHRLPTNTVQNEKKEHPSPSLRTGCTLQAREGLVQFSTIARAWGTPIQNHI